jgi:PI-3-kinase-related kinase SMG-1
MQWADGTVPLFGIYKSWQARQQATDGAADGAVRRPSDLFYDKIIPALKEHGITRATSRKGTQFTCFTGTKSTNTDAGITAPRRA